MQREAAKEWTQIFTSWITVVGLVGGGIFALAEYQGNKKDTRIQRSLAHLGKFASKEISEARVAIALRQDAKVNRLREILLNRETSQEERNAAYYIFVVHELVAHGTTDGIQDKIYLVLNTLEEAIICGEQGLCDEATLRAGFFDYGQGFVRTYTPYLCYLRRAWNDPALGRRAEAYFNPAAPPDVCEQYHTSLEQILPKPTESRETDSGGT
jgi:hypothetical protein